MTTTAEICETRKKLREILYSWIGIVEITELKRLLLSIDKMLKEYQEIGEVVDEIEKNPTAE